MQQIDKRRNTHENPDQNDETDQPEDEFDLDLWENLNKTVQTLLRNESYEQNCSDIVKKLYDFENFMVL